MAQRFHTFLMTTEKGALKFSFISSQPEKNLDLSVKEETPIAFLQHSQKWNKSETFDGISFKLNLTVIQI